MVLVGVAIPGNYQLLVFIAQGLVGYQHYAHRRVGVELPAIRSALRHCDVPGCMPASTASLNSKQNIVPIIIIFILRCGWG